MSFIFSSAKIKGIKCTDNPTPITGGNLKLPLIYDEITDTGYYGIVSSSELFTGTELSTSLGLTDGVLHNDDVEWLHFYVGKDAACNRDEHNRPYAIYIAKKTIRHTISWDHIDGVGAVTGTEVSSKVGKNYICRVPTGADSDPSTTATTNKSEWNALMYRIHTEVPAGQVGTNWESFNDTETNITVGNGKYSWCQEHYNDTARVLRGYHSTVAFNINTLSGVNYGFRPCLISFTA